MLDSKKGFTCTWGVDNFGMLPHQTRDGLQSPSFVVGKWKKIRFYLDLYPRGKSSDLECISIYLRKVLDASTDQNFKFAFSLTLVSTEPSSSITASKEKYEETLNNGFSHFVDWKYILERKRLFLPQDTLTLRCHILPSDEPSEESESTSDFMRRCSIRTGILVNRRCITLHVQNINDLRNRTEKVSFDLETAFRKCPGLSVSLHFIDFLNIGFVKIEIRQTSLPFKKELYGKCKMTVISAHKEYQDSKESTHLFQKSLDDVWHFPDFLITSNMTPDKYLYQDDTLFLQCEFSYTCQNDTYYLETNYSPLTFEAKEERSVSDLVANLKDLYLGGNFCDVDLRAGGETFTAHKVVLCAVSPVFRAMFENDMREKDSSVVEIEDVDPDTLRRMLAFIYSEVLKEDMSLEDAISLYCAADKYDIVAMKRRCSLLLTSSMSVATVCEVLVLADARRDNFLMTAVHNFLCSHANETFYSEHWKRFMDDYPRLSGEIMHQMWMKKWQL